MEGTLVHDIANLGNTHTIAPQLSVVARCSRGTTGRSAELVRHADIRTTMNIYGDIVTDEMSVVGGKVTRLALNGR
jgi:hypothetical protein